MAASYRSTDWLPPPTRSANALNMDKSVLQDDDYQDSISIHPPPLSGFHIGADTITRPHRAHEMKNEMFYRSNGVPSDLQRLSKNQPSMQYLGGGDLCVDDIRHFFPSDSSNQQQYPVPEHIRVSPEFQMFKANYKHLHRHENERNISATDYLENAGLQNNIFGEPLGLDLNNLSRESMFLPMASTRKYTGHLGSTELSANGFDMGPLPRNDPFESAASLSYREQTYNQSKIASSSSSSSAAASSSLPPLDVALSGRYSDLCHFPDMHDMLTDRIKGPRASLLNGKSKMINCRDRIDQQALLSDAKFFVIKSYNEDNVYKSIKYSVWASTKNGNKKLDTAYREAKRKPMPCPVFLFFSVNASSQFCGVAEMVGPVDFNTSVEYWQQDRWSGHFPVKWFIVKDVQNSLFRHIIIESNDNKPVTNSRDTQEVGMEQGIEMLNIFKRSEMRSSMLDDFSFYEERQRAAQNRKARQLALLEALRVSSTSVPTLPTHSSLHDDYVMVMSKRFEEALALQHKLN